MVERVVKQRSLTPRIAGAEEGHPTTPTSAPKAARWYFRSVMRFPAPAVTPAAVEQLLDGICLFDLALRDQRGRDEAPGPR
jgi:hypothetical protein